MEKVYVVIRDFRFEKVDAKELHIEKLCRKKADAEKCVAELAQVAEEEALKVFDVEDLEIEKSTDSYSVYKNYEYDTYHEDIWIVEKTLD